MSRTQLRGFAVAAGFAALLIATQGGSSISANQDLAPAGTLGDGYSLADVDAAVVSPECTSAADPLACTADADAATLAADAAADAASPELLADDGAVTDAASEPSTTELAAAASWVDPLAADPSMDDAPWSDPAVDLAAQPAPSVAATDPSLQLESSSDVMAAATAVRPIARGFNTRQEADYLGDGNSQRWDAAWARIGGTHVRVHRLAVYWWDVQCKGPGSWDFDKYVRVAQAASARNIRLILTPVGSPNWARSSGRRTPTTSDGCVPDDASGLGLFAHPDNLNAWATFIQHMTATFKPYNPLGYEIWNEENSRDFWDRVGNPNRVAGPPCPTCWTRLYCLATQQIDRTDPGKAVGMGGLAAYHSNQYATVNGARLLKNMRSSAFLQTAYAARQRLSVCAGRPFDYVGYHPYVFRPYEDGQTPSGGIGNTATMIELRSVRQMMLNHGDRAKRIWNTEWGFPSGTFIDGGASHTIGEPRQATLIRTEHAYLAGLKDPSGFHYMRFSILFNPIDSFPNDLFSHIGVVWVSHANADDANDPAKWRNKPSYATWAALPQP
jgi:hypothetical protein